MKKGFVMYYDNCRRLERLPDKHYAAAMKCVITYTERLANGVDAERYLKDRLAEMSAETAMAVSFMTDDARRDHERYLETIARRGRKKTNDADRELMKYAGESQKTSGRSAGGQQLDDAWNYVGDEPRKQKTA